jgi:hypothetical protein
MIAGAGSASAPVHWSLGNYQAGTTRQIVQHEFAATG